MNISCLTHSDDSLFVDSQGGKVIASATKSMSSTCLSDCMIAFPSTGRGKRLSQAHTQSMNISCLSNSDDCLFLDRQGGKAIASVAESLKSSFLSDSTIAFSSTGRG